MQEYWSELPFPSLLHTHLHTLTYLHTVTGMLAYSLKCTLTYQVTRPRAHSRSHIKLVETRRFRACCSRTVQQMEPPTHSGEGRFKSNKLQHQALRITHTGAPASRGPCLFPLLLVLPAAYSHQANYSISASPYGSSAGSRKDTSSSRHLSGTC